MSSTDSSAVVVGFGLQSADGWRRLNLSWTVGDCCHFVAVAEATVDAAAVIAVIFHWSCREERSR